MNTNTVTLTLPQNVIAELDTARRQQHCTRDELLCDALRLYVEFGDHLRRIQALH